jgi:CRP-like cAMP-binding protein
MENVSLFEGLGKSIERKKGDLLFKQGEKDNSIYIVKHGLLKAFYLTLDGKELIKSFIQPGEFIGSLIACYLDEPGTFNLMCLEDSSLQRVSFTELQ